MTTKLNLKVARARCFAAPRHQLHSAPAPSPGMSTCSEPMGTSADQMIPTPFYASARPPAGHAIAIEATVAAPNQDPNAPGHVQQSSYRVARVEGSREALASRAT
jgi:hypothetical protein